MTKMTLPPAAGTSRTAAAGESEPGPVSPEFIEQVMLLVSELVTNGVGHGNGPAGASVEVSLGVEPHGIRLKIGDPRPSQSVCFETERSAVAAEDRSS
jgi:anti-sigma regulatory factor (Ser/Thr protein kinase)